MCRVYGVGFEVSKVLTRPSVCWSLSVSLSLFMSLSCLQIRIWFSATSPAGLPTGTIMELTSETGKPAPTPLNAFLYQSCLEHGVSSQQ